MISIYLFFYGIAAVLGVFLNRHKRVKYKGNRMYLYGQIAGRLRSNRTVLATLSLLTLLTLLFLCIALKFNEVKQLGDARFAPYDIMASGNEQLKMKSVERKNEDLRDEIAIRDETIEQLQTNIKQMQVEHSRAMMNNLLPVCERGCVLFCH